MTSDEQKELERQKEWVKARLNCTIQGVLNCLATTLRYDVNTYNDSVQNHQFEVSNIDGNIGVVIRKTGNRESFVEVRIKDSIIQVSRNNEQILTVTPQWDENSLECKLLVDGNDTPLSYPQISQRAIGGFLFQGQMYPPVMKDS